MRCEMSWDDFMQWVDESGLTFLEAEDIVVTEDDLKLALTDREVRENLRHMLDTIELYEHGFFVNKGKVIVNAPKLGEWLDQIDARLRG